MAPENRPFSSASLAARQGRFATLALAVAGSVLLALAARVQVPMWPVPMTMQTAVVLLLAASGGLGIGAGAVAVYIAEAAAGLPVLAFGLPLFAAGPTLGYVAGFFLAAVWVGFAAERGWTRRALPLLAVLGGGEALIYGAGLMWLRAAFVSDMRTALAVGLAPFVAGEAVKFALTFAAVLAFARRKA